MRTAEKFSRYFLLLLLFGLISPLQGATIIAKFLGEMLSTPILRSIDTGSSWSKQTVGIMHFQRTGGTASPTPTDFYGFCIEPAEGVTTNQTYTYTYDILSSGATNINGMGATKADYLRQLYEKFAPAFNASMLDDVTARALQIASWEIVRETSGTFNVSNGSIRFSSSNIGGQTLTAAESTLAAAAMTRAQTYLSSLVDPATYTEKPYYFALTRTGNQDIGVYWTPEPLTIGLVGLGLLGMLAYTSRRGHSGRS